jgi:uncharacterized protein involved in exopolysaccharide biosynthesis
MNIAERLGELVTSALTISADIKHLRDLLGETRQEVSALTRDVHDIRERVVRLETQREADRAQMAAELARFKAEVERAALRSGESGPRALGEHGG